MSSPSPLAAAARYARIAWRVVVWLVRLPWLAYTSGRRLLAWAKRELVAQAPRFIAVLWLAGMGVFVVMGAIRARRVWIADERAAVARDSERKAEEEIEARLRAEADKKREEEERLRAFDLDAGPPDAGPKEASRDAGAAAKSRDASVSDGAPTDASDGAPTDASDAGKMGRRGREGGTHLAGGEGGILEKFHMEIELPDEPASVSENTDKELREILGRDLALGGGDDPELVAILDGSLVDGMDPEVARIMHRLRGDAGGDATISLAGLRRDRDASAASAGQERAGEGGAPLVEPGAPPLEPDRIPEMSRAPLADVRSLGDGALRALARAWPVARDPTASVPTRDVRAVGPAALRAIDRAWPRRAVKPVAAGSADAARLVPPAEQGAR